MWPSASEFHCASTTTARRGAPAPGFPDRVRRKVAAHDGVVLRMRRGEAARKRQHAFFALRAHRFRRFRERVARRLRRVERVGVVHDRVDPCRDARDAAPSTSCAFIAVELVDPVLAPLERADQPLVLADRRELLLPAMEVIANHDVSAIAASAASAAWTSAGVRPLWPTSCRPIGRPARRAAARQRDRGMSREVERLRAAQHQRAHRVGAALDRHGRGAKRRRGNGERRATPARRRRRARDRLRARSAPCRAARGCSPRRARSAPSRAAAARACV